jgi:hypothetical protein
MSKTTIIFKKEVSNVQPNSGDFNEINQNNNPKLEETSKFLEKMNLTKAKFIYTFIVVACGIGIGYLVNRLPDVDKIQFLGEHFLILLGIGVFALIQIFVTWRNG